MKDINGIELKVGDEVERTSESGNVQRTTIMEIARECFGQTEWLIGKFNGVVCPFDAHGWRKVSGPKLTVTAIEPSAGVITVEPPPPRDANGREIKVGDRVRWAQRFGGEPDWHRTVRALNVDCNLHSAPGAVAFTDGSWLKNAGLAVVIATPAPQPADAPEEVAAPPPVCADCGAKLRCCDELCPECDEPVAPETSASGSGESTLDPSPPAPEPITCDERERCLDCNVLAVCEADLSADGPFCSYCAHRRRTVQREREPNIPKPPGPIVDTEGECWERPGWSEP